MRLQNCEYDAIISLGGNCSVGLQLKHRGLRQCSLPLDWTLMMDVEPILKLPQLIKDRFRGFLNYSNAVEYEPAILEAGARTFRILDKGTGFRFTHHFKGSEFTPSLFAAGRSVIDRRIRRLYSVVGSSQRVLFVLTTFFAYDFELAERIYDALTQTFAGQEINLVVMQFNASSQTETWLRGGRMVVCTYLREFNIVYDNQFSAPEWCWMDSLRIRGVCSAAERRKKDLLIKWGFKLWWTFGRWLEGKGAGIANMRFRDFGIYTFKESQDARRA